MTTSPAATESTNVVSGPTRTDSASDTGGSVGTMSRSQPKTESQRPWLSLMRESLVERAAIYGLVRARAALRAGALILVVCSQFTASAAAQSWKIAAGDSTARWPDGVPRGKVSGLTAHYQSRGFFFARVDSVVQIAADSVAYVVLGDRSAIRSARQVGADGKREMEVERIIESIRENVFDTRTVDGVATRALEFYERQGFVETRITLDSVVVEGPAVDLLFRIEEGYNPLFLGLLLGGRTRASIRYLERATGLIAGSRLTAFDAPEIRDNLLRTGVFATVEPPLLLPAPDSSAIVQLVLEDRAPGSFDFALGYLPPSGTRAGSIVGSGNLALRNIFGAGRSLSIELDRLPGQTSSLTARIADPFVLGLRAGGEASFVGYQQDSTYSKQQYEIGMSLKLGQAVLTGHAVAEVSRPGTAGLRLTDGQQLVPNSRASLGGLGIRFGSSQGGADSSPGLALEIRFLRGRKTFRDEGLQSGDTLSVERRLKQERFESSIRWRKPLNRALWLVLGMDLRTLVSDVVDASDLYRLGGAKTLRGYDEDRFRGETAGRSVLEIRRRIQEGSVGFGFVDIGVVGDSRAQARWSVYPGFGFGLLLESAAGLINVSYAMNLEDGLTAGRVHFGLAFGL
jgi:outer membrane protein insertion porin family